MVECGTLKVGSGPSDGDSGNGGSDPTLNLDGRVLAALGALVVLYVVTRDNE